MNIEYNEFIGVYKNVYHEGYCEFLIETFNRLEANSVGSNRQQSENALRHKKNDYQIMFDGANHNIGDFNNTHPRNIFFDGLQACYNEYTNQYSILKEGGEIRGTAMKMQKTRPGGGYHIWHAEQGGTHSANRVLVYTLYLNTLEDGDGGETEFLYQKKRFKPQANTMILWPAAFTHPHRGNTVLGEKDKYIVTGWFYYD